MRKRQQRAAGGDLTALTKVELQFRFLLSMDERTAPMAWRRLYHG
jgi:hypothetical protein